MKINRHLVFFFLLCNSVFCQVIEGNKISQIYEVRNSNAEEIFSKILDDETSNKMPQNIIEEAKKNFVERMKGINWDTYHNDLPFNPSALSLYKWAPIAEELKNLDRKIVLNSVILKWNVVKKEFDDRIKF